VSEVLSVIRGPGSSTAFTNEPTTKLTANTRYQLNTDAKRLLDPAVAVTVEVDADGGGGGAYAVADPSTYSINYLFGIVTFLADQGSAALVRVSASYLPVLDLAGVREWNYTCSRTVLETTETDDEDRTRKLGLKDLSGALTLIELPTYDHDPGGGELILEDAIENGTPLLFEREAVSSGKRFRAWVLLESAEDTAGIDDLFNTNFNMTGAAQADGGAGYGWEP
jgi:hypothetical protein